MSFSHYQSLPQTSTAEEQHLKSSLQELGQMLVLNHEYNLHDMVESWFCFGEFEFKKGTIWQLLKTNVSNLQDVFDYKFIDRLCSLPRAVERNQYHVNCLLRNLDHGDWMDQWSAVTSEHLDNALTTWNYEYFQTSNDSEESGDENEDDIDGHVSWPPPDVNYQDWFTTTVSAFGQLENAFDSLNTIYILQELNERNNENFAMFQTLNITEPLKLLKKMREFLISMSSSGRLKQHHAKLAWGIFAEKLLDSCIKTQNLVMYA